MHTPIDDTSTGFKVGDRIFCFSRPQGFEWGWVVEVANEDNRSSKACSLTIIFDDAQCMVVDSSLCVYDPELWVSF